MSVLNDQWEAVGQRHGRGGSEVMRRQRPIGRPRDGGATSLREAGAMHAVACLLPRTHRMGAYVVAAVLVFGIVVIVGFAIGGLASGLAPSVPQSTTTVAVAPGQTPWELARTHAPDSDTRAVVQRIEELNDISAGAISAGTVLTVPVERASP